MKKALFLLLILIAGYCFGQPAIYSPANLHSHNDYEKPKPFLKLLKMDLAVLRWIYSLKMENYWWPITKKKSIQQGR